MCIRDYDGIDGTGGQHGESEIEWKWVEEERVGERKVRGERRGTG